MTRRPGPAVGQVFHLGVKELVSLTHDPAVLVFMIYAFTVQVAMFARAGSVELRNATIAIVDEDNSVLSHRIGDAFRLPYFQAPARLSAREIDPDLDRGRYTFVLDIPPGFERDIRTGHATSAQLLVDATVLGQSFAGAAYIQEVVSREVSTWLRARDVSPVVTAMVRVRYNPNLESHWLMGVMELAIAVTMLAIVLPAAALLREREHGTIGHLLVMPLTPGQIVAAKLWANTLVVFVGTIACFGLIVQGILQVPVRGSLAAFLFATLLFQMATAGLGIFIATLARSVPNLALMLIVIMVPMLFLSGGWTPREAMPPAVRGLMQLSPLTHYVEVAGAVVFRGATLAELWKELASITAIGATVLVLTMSRFRATFTATRS